MFLRHPLLLVRGIGHGFGTRFSEPAGSEVRFFRQVHGQKVLEVRDGKEEGPPPEADGGWTSASGISVAVWTADCLPVLISDPEGRHVSAVHAGWRGAVRGIVPEAIRLLKEASGMSPEELLAVIGPSVKSCCYPVGEEVWSEVRQRWPGWSGVSGQPRLDLPGLVRYQLEQAGFQDKSIGEIPLCTVCHPELFYSHRGMGEKRAGRSMLNFIRRSR